jgi:hypothetical protein
MIKLLLLIIAKTPAGVEFVTLIVPVNGWPSLQVAMTVATVAPNGVVFGIEGAGGSNDKLSTGGGAGAGAAGVNSTST